MTIYHVDVFSSKPYGGNGLTVVIHDKALTDKEMQRIACEFKQFETIFLKKIQSDVYEARIFTVEEELEFAGHPILGGVAIIHQEFFAQDSEKIITLKLKNKDVVATSKTMGLYYEVTMNQGTPQWLKKIDQAWKEKYCKALNLRTEDLSQDYPMEVVSTGLPYLLVPIVAGLDHVKISCEDFESQLAKNQAKFVYIFDLNKMEGRTWDNRGSVEDVATGSAAGPMGAYLYKHGFCDKNETVLINQGRYVDRSSVLKVSCRRETDEICVTGEVVVLMKGELEF